MLTGPRNFTTKPIKKGHLDSVLIDKVPGYVSSGFNYEKAILKTERDPTNDGHKKCHDNKWKYA